MGVYRIAGVQLETGKNPGKNIEKLKKIVEKAGNEGPDFIIIPEMFEIVAKPQDVNKYTHQIPCELTNMLSKFARHFNVNIIGGSFFEMSGNKVYNTCTVYNRRGEMVGKYRKMHLFDAFGFNESSAIAPGDSPFIGELDGLKFGVAICYDIRFPEIFRFYADRGVDIVFVPAAFFQPNHDHWQLNIRARALDNTIFIATANQTGRLWVGRSMVSDPWGVSIASAGMEEGYYLATIDTDRIKNVREKLPTYYGKRFRISLI